MAGFDLHDLVTRSRGEAGHHDISANLAEQAFALANEAIMGFLTDDLGLAAEGDTGDAFSRFTASLDEANRQGLIGRGGVPERNFLALWLIADGLRPDLYVESGVFKGSSLFAVASTGRVKTAIGFDPAPAAWRAGLGGQNVALSRHAHDFSDHDFGEVPDAALLYFDDHINTAQRILQARNKGFRHLIFDDSCGLMGTCERMWPSLPTLFFIMNIEKFRAGDFVAWPKETFREKRLFGGRLSLRLRQDATQNRFEITDAVIDLCKQARAAVAHCGKIPDLSDFIVTRRSLDANDISQHFVVLK